MGWGLALVCALWGAMPAHASLAYDLDVPTLTAQARLVVRAQVVSRSSRWSPDGRRIITESVLRVRSVLKGRETSTEIRVVQPGGAVGGIVQQVSGAATFEISEDVVVFLSQRGADDYAVVGMALGKYRVGVSRESGRLVAFRDGLEGVSLLDPEGRALDASAAGAGVPYTELIRAIQTAGRETR